MSEPHDDTGRVGPFHWAFASLGGWSRLLTAAQELRHADEERFDALLAASRAEPFIAEEAQKVRSLVRMLNDLALDLEALERTHPTTMRAMEAACVGCRDRDRCDRELDRGTAPRDRAEFCPNTPRFDALLRTATA